MVEVTLRRSGHTTVMPVPATLLVSLGWEAGDALALSIEGPYVVINKVAVREPVKMLVVSRPNESEELIPWDEEAIKRFKLEDHELSMLNRGKLLWRDEVAFEIEELGK